MSLNDDFDIEMTESEESELSEKEYSDILGLRGKNSKSIVFLI